MRRRGIRRSSFKARFGLCQASAATSRLELPRGSINRWAGYTITGGFWFHVRFGSKADMCSAHADVRYVPKADIAGTQKKSATTQT